MSAHDGSKVVLIGHGIFIQLKRTLFQKGWRTGTVLFALILFSAVISVTFRASAETRPGGSDNGLTSRLVTLSNTLSGLGYGTTTNTPDWGQHWNRISTASQWVPSGDVTASDVKSGKTFYNGNRTQQTGTYSTPGVCSTQAYNDNHASATQANNCTTEVAWTTPSDGITGTDKKDSRTGLIWSKALSNSGGTIVFVDSSPASLTYDSTGGNNTGLTAAQLCSARGNGWRLPTQKELMQAYIDGAHFNLTSVNNYWSGTIDTSLSRPFYVHLGAGISSTTYTNYVGYFVRCVR